MKTSLTYECVENPGNMTAVRHRFGVKSVDNEHTIDLYTEGRFIDPNHMSLAFRMLNLTYGNIN